MNIVEYQAFCEDFFKQEQFQSEQTLEQAITQLSAEDFSVWNQAMIEKYDKKYDVIRAIIKQMRDKENFKVTGSNVDWDNDAIKQEENRIIVRTYQNVYNDVFEKEIKNYQIYLKKMTELQDHIKQTHYQESLKVSVDDKNFVAEQVIDVLWSGWECDSSAWLVTDQGQKKVIASNHGQTYFADKAFLEDKIKEYQEALEKTQAMLNQL